jgi:hypothetical protein
MEGVLTMAWSYSYLSAACVLSLKTIGQRNNETNRTSGIFQAVIAEFLTWENQVFLIYLNKLRRQEIRKLWL